MRVVLHFKEVSIEDKEAFPTGVICGSNSRRLKRVFDSVLLGTVLSGTVYRSDADWSY